MDCCPFCGNMWGFISYTDGTKHCSVCKRFFKDTTYFATANTPLVKANFSTASIENNITIGKGQESFPDVEYYRKGEDLSVIKALEECKLTINAKDIIIKDDKISITIDKDSIDKFNVIEINGVRFVREDN